MRDLVLLAGRLKTFASHLRRKSREEESVRLLALARIVNAAAATYLVGDDGELQGAADKMGALATKLGDRLEVETGTRMVDAGPYLPDQEGWLHTIDDLVVVARGPNRTRPRDVAILLNTIGWHISRANAYEAIGGQFALFATSPMQGSISELCREHGVIHDDSDEGYDELARRLTLAAQRADERFSAPNVSAEARSRRRAETILRAVLNALLKPLDRPRRDAIRRMIDEVND